jgi:ribosome recycling factor
MPDRQLKDAEARMFKAIEALEHDLATVRTGRASGGLVENLKVDYYGTPTPLNQLAGISVPDARLIVIQPYDRSSLETIEKAILKSDIGLTPSNDGTVVRLTIPPLTDERRQDLAKQVRKRVEEGRVEVRNIRRDIHDRLRKMEHDSEISQDELHRAENDLQKVTDEQIKLVDEVGQGKEQELLNV